MSTGSGSMTAVTTGVGDMMDIVSTMLTTITGNAILCALLACGFIAAALRILKKIKKAARA